MHSPSVQVGMQPPMGSKVRNKISFLVIGSWGDKDQNIESFNSVVYSLLNVKALISNPFTPSEKQKKSAWKLHNLQSSVQLLHFQINKYK